MNWLFSIPYCLTIGVQFTIRLPLVAVMKRIAGYRFLSQCKRNIRRCIILIKTHSKKQIGYIRSCGHLVVFIRNSRICCQLAYGRVYVQHSFKLFFRYSYSASGQLTLPGFRKLNRLLSCLEDRIVCRIVRQLELPARLTAGALFLI